MINSTKINNHLNTISAFEGIKVRLTSRGEYTNCLYKIYADSVDLDFDGVGICYGQYSEKYSGKLVIALENINKYIAEQFAPIIASQKEEIKKLL